MFTSSNVKKFLAGAAVIASVGIFASIAQATHSWGGYHWARTSNPLTLKLGDNVSDVWDSYLDTAGSDWSASSVLDTFIVRGGTNPKNCRATNGRVEVCSSKYGNNGWLGLASVWVNGSHITQGTVKVNDTYFNTATYNTPAWRNLVMCQEIGHTFGLDHQDEDFSNPNLGTCMDYTSNPSSNQHPNEHDYAMLEEIYAHLDVFTSSSRKEASALASARGEIDTSNPSEWGRVVREDAKNRSSIHERDLPNGEKLFTFVVWAK